ncbi:MAG: hypothetical protein IJR22_07065 [Acidaminococcaceae bacterium]|nr:hypothetical protein [Acidaminococcaceae bacterium]
MAGWASELLGGHSVISSGLRADLISANFLLALVLLVFVGFFCIRMLSNTKTACCLTVGIFFIVLFYLQLTLDAVLPVLKAIANDALRIIGAVCCILSVIAVVKGLADEEKSEQYVHRRAYWCACIVLLYFGLFLIGAGMNR